MTWKRPENVLSNVLNGMCFDVELPCCQDRGFIESIHLKFVDSVKKRRRKEVEMNEYKEAI
jgi:hypothetical protein